MNIADLRIQCQARVDRGIDTIAVVVPGKAYGNTKRLAGRSGPRGEIVCENEKDCIVAFSVKDILKWLDKKGL